MATEARPSPAVTEPSWRFRVYVWEVPVRVTHWVTVGSIAVLTVTGLYLAEPFIIPNGGPVMGTMRFIHYVAAVVFVSSGIVRTYWLLAGNRFSRWRAFIPTNRAHLRELVAQTGWYLFLRRTAPKVLGHNALAAGTYLVVFTLLGLQAVTGFALIGTDGTQPFAALFGWLSGIIGIQTVRLVHHLLMWALIAFMIHHVYSALLVDHWERNGLMSSIFSGYKFATLREIIGARDSGDDLDEIVDIDEDAE